MLIIIAAHPIQYHVPLWQKLAKDGRVPMEVWYLTHHTVKTSHDREFGKSFAWDIDMLTGYPHRLLSTPPGATPTSFFNCRAVEPLEPMFKRSGARAIWVLGWQVLGYWQAVWAAKRAGVKVWLRGESNDLAPVPSWKLPLKRIALNELFKRVDRFFCIGSANRRLYLGYGVDEERTAYAPYAVDNERFRVQAQAFRPSRAELRKRWGIAEDAFCVLFCGKFIAKKRPLDLVSAATMAAERAPNLHLLFVGSGELDSDLRKACHVNFDADCVEARSAQRGSDKGPLASFAGFLNQTEISRAYVAADCLVLPSDHRETWGLVVNEAMASGLPCLISDRCGSAEDLGTIAPNRVFPFRDVPRLAENLVRMATAPVRATIRPDALAQFSFERTLKSVVEAYEV